ncbi:hypothetical protein [Robertkochia solimangrovi]|uniref:hypothetical protein n=1 Tax=Robertkochia solimangrovi TaxID=2213046 RepID=UPI00118009B6|nr:hypothetical protein [Robertkochia solimangrovi]TRZ41260.1 hypothetical protein DMZ48_17670 [Robertkochia solimangrovi]
MSHYFNPRYMEWKSADEMHEDSKSWLSELEFMITEQHFLDDLFGNYFIKLSSEKYLEKGRDLVERLEMSKNGVKSMIRDVQKHNNELEILLDGVDQPYEEKEVKADHLLIRERMHELSHGFKELKSDFFILIGNIMVAEKRKRLLS